MIVISLQNHKNQYSEVRDFIAPPPLIEHYTVGLKYQIADALWVRSLQDLDYCENLISKNLCKGHSWLAKMILTIVTLDPEFQKVYRSGGLALTVLVSDYLGASQVFDLGVSRYPKDGKLLFAAAYHALFEERNIEKAGDLYRRAGENGAPAWSLVLGNKLSTPEGQIEVGERVIEELRKSFADENEILRMQERIDQLKAELQQKKLDPAKEASQKGSPSQLNNLKK